MSANRSQLSAPRVVIIAIFSGVRTQVTVGEQGERGKQGEKDRRYAHVRSDCPNLIEYRYIRGGDGGHTFPIPHSRGVQLSAIAIWCMVSEQTYPPFPLPPSFLSSLLAGGTEGGSPVLSSFGSYKLHMASFPIPYLHRKLSDPELTLKSKI